MPRSCQSGRMSTQFKQQYESTPLQGANATYVEALYEAFLSEPGSVSAAWRRYFSSLGSDIGDVAHGPIVKAIGERARRRGAPTGGKARLAAPPGGQASAKQAAVSRLIQVYSLRGHLIADLDPLGLWERPTPAVLKLDYLGLGAADFDREFYTGGLAGTGQSRMKLREILALLKRIYCGKLAAEFAHISRARERLWLRERFESCMADWKIDTDEQRAILNSLTRAQGIERYLHTKYVRPEALLTGGRRDVDPDARRRDPAGRRARCSGDRHRHGSSRPHQRARQRAGQVAAGTPHGVRRHIRSRDAQGFR